MQRFLLLLGLGWTIFLHAGEYKVFFGNLHSHTSYSDGSGTPSEAYRYARNRAKLDFLAITEHNHKSAEGSAVEKNHKSIAHDHQLYQKVIEAANNYTESNKFVAFYGQEFSSTAGGNHVNVFEIANVIDEAVVPKKQFDKLVGWLSTHKDSQGQNAIIQFNHPKSDQRSAGVEYGADDFGGTVNWLREMGKHASLISVLNGPSHDHRLELETTYDTVGAYLHYISIGFKLGPTADQDNHYKNWGLATHARTAVIAESLTKEGILNGLRNRNVYSTQDKNLRLIFFVQGRICGEVVNQLPGGNSALSIQYSIVDDDEADASYLIEVFSGKIGGAPVKTAVEKARTTGNNSLANLKQVESVAFTGSGQYVLFKITQETEHGHADVAWTAPVWFENAAPTGPLIATPAEGIFIASKNSSLFHISADCSSVKRISAANRLVGADARKDRELHEGCPR